MTAFGAAAPHVHDLEPLYAAVSVRIRHLPPLPAILALNPYAVQIRYADDWWEPTLEETEQAFQTALRVREAVLGALADWRAGH